MNLNEHGAACRCLLRLRENEGEPGMSDTAFIARYLPSHPEWRDRPGATDPSTVLAVARDLGLAERMESVRDYARVLQEHRAGRGILVYTKRAPLQADTLAARPYVMLIVKANDDAFTLWCPYPSGQSDTLPEAPRIWWDQWLATGVVLHRAA